MSEIRKITRKYYLRQIVACFLVSCLFFNTSIVLAIEQGNLTGASGLMGATWGDQAILNTANNAILDWSNFDTTNTQSVTFNQYISGILNSNSAVLNRISSGSVPTQFNGALAANGRVFIVNPAGVLFGAGARINVAQLVASSLNIRNQDFIEGKYDFSGGGFGPVINEGEIVADSLAALIGTKVLNTGMITCPKGLVVMAAGDRVLLGQPGSDVVVEVVSVTPSDILGDALADGDVINEGTVNAAGGKIILAAGDTFSKAIDGLEGLSVAVESGTGRVGQFGTITADGVEGDGGSITLTAGDVVALGPDSVTTANAGANGDGGEVIVYSPETALFRDGALVEAKGGSESGNGGFFELSGKEYVEVMGDVDLSAAYGQVGNFLIDPRDIKIVPDGTNNNGSYSPGLWTANDDLGWSLLAINILEGYLNTSNVTISTQGSGSEAGHVDFDAGRDLKDGTSGGSGWSLTVDAYRDIYLHSGINFTGSGSVALWAGDDIRMYSGAGITTGGGNVALYAGSQDGDGQIDLQTGSNGITLNGNGDLAMGASSWIQTNSPITLNGSGNATLDAGTGNLLINSPLTMAGGDLLLDSGYNIIVDDGVDITGAGNMVATALHGIQLGGNVQASGDMTLGADTDFYWGHDVRAKGTLDAGGEMDIEGTNVYLEQGANAGGDMTLYAHGLWKLSTPGDTLAAAGDVDASGKLTAGGTIEITATEFPGGVTTGPGLSGGSVAYNSDGTIYLRDDVTAGVDLKLNNDTQATTEGMTLKGGNNVELAGDLTGYKDLTIEATGGSISSSGTISVTGSKLTMEQLASLNTADYTFANQSNTDLTLVSTGGSVSATAAAGGNAADKWQSIGAHANQNITLGTSGGGSSNYENTIKLGDSGTAGKSLWAENGYIDIDGFSVKTADDFDDWSVEAGGYVDMYVVHELRINGDVTSGGYMSLFADYDTRFGSHVLVEGLVDSGATTHIEGMNVFLDGGAVSEGDMTIIAHGLYGIAYEPAERLQYSGDVRAGALLESKTGKVEITAVRATGHPDENLTSLGYNYLDTTEGPYFGMSIPAYADEYTGSILVQDVKAATSVDMTAGYDIEADNVTAGTTFDAEAGRDITLASAISGGNMTLAADKDTTDIYSGDVTAGPLTSLGGDVEISASDNTIFLNGNVTAGDDVILHNNTEAADGVKIEAGDDIHVGGDDAAFASSEHPPGAYEYKNLTGLGDLALKSGSNGNGYGNITIGGELLVCGDLIMIAGGGTDPAGIIGWEQSNIKIVGPVITLAGGNMYAKAGDDIQLYGLKPDGTSHPAGGALSSGNMILIAYDDVQTFNNAGLTTIDPAKGDMYISAGDDDAIIGPEPWEKEVVVTGEVDSAGKLTVKAQDDIELKRNVKSADDMRMRAGDDIELNEWSGNTESGGMMKLIAGVSNPGGDVEGWGQLTTTNLANGAMLVKAADDIYLDNTPISAQSAGTMIMVADSDDNYDGDLTVNGDLIGNMTLSGYNVTESGNIISTGPLNVYAKNNINLRRSVSSVGDMRMFAGNDASLNEWSGGTSSEARMKIEANHDIRMYGPAFAENKMVLTANADAAGDGGYLYIFDNLATCMGDIILTAFNGNWTGLIYMYGDPGDSVSAGRDLLINSRTYANDGRILRAGRDVTVADGMFLKSLSPWVTGGDLTVEAGRDITLGGEVETAGDLRLIADKDNDGGTMWAKSSLTTTGSTGSGDIYAEGQIIKVDGYVDSAGKVEMTAGAGYSGPFTPETGGITLGNWVKAVDDIILRGISGDDWGKVEAYGSLTSLTGKIDILTDYYIELYGPVNAYTNLIMKADTVSYGDSYITAYDTLTAQTGNLEASAEQSITFNDVATAGNNMMLNADLDNDGLGELDVHGLVAGGNINLSAGDDTINIHKSADGSATVDVDAGGDIILNNNAVADDGVKLDADDDVIAYGTVTGLGDLTIEAGVIKPDSAGDHADIILHDDVTTAGDLQMSAGDDITAHGKLLTTGTNGNGDMTLNAGDDIYLNETPVSAEAEGQLQLIADLDTLNGNGNVDVAGDLIGNMTLSGTNVYVDGSVTSNGTLDVDADKDIRMKRDISSVGAMTMNAGDDIELNKWSGDTTSGGSIVLNADISEWDGKVYVGGDISANGGDMEITGANIKIKGDVYANGNVEMNARETGYQWFDLGNVSVYGDIDSTGNVEIFADDHITLGTFWGGKGNVDADGDVKLIAHNDGDGLFGDVKVYGDIDAGGFVEIDALYDTIHLWGDVFAGDYIHLMANTEFEGWFDQHLDAGTWIQADGYLNKLNSWCGWWSNGSLYLHAAGDISLADDVTAAICCPEMCWSAGGGVSIISDYGRIYTPGKYVMDKDGIEQPALAIDITGRSDQFGWWGPVGVDLPYGPGKAAIVIQSEEGLFLHRWSDLTACGTYYEPVPVDGFWSVDDRVGVGFLAEPATIGGFPRNQGDPFDAAIYVGSRTGDVHLGGEVDIRSREWVPYEPGNGLNGFLVEALINGCGEWICVNKGAMIADAYDTVTFGDKFEDSLADGRVGDRLEVVSRITEWLEDAVGRLPYVYGGGPFPAGYNYVLRGAGLENAGITDGRAWVLESRIPPAPLNELQLFGAEQQVPGVAGCPAVMAAAAEELGIDEGNIEVAMADAMADATDIQPCDTCARLVDAAAILSDEDGARMAALAEVINTVAPADVPFTPEVGTLIAAAFEGRAGDGTAYATALEYIDAFVAYVSILDTEMDSPVGDSVEFVMSKHGTGVTTNPNSNIAAYVAARLEAIAG